MTKNGPLIANLLLDGIWDENIVTEEKRLFHNIFNNPNNVKISPILYEGELKAGTFSLRIVNDFDVPLNMAFDFIKKSTFTLGKPFPKHITLAPNTVKQLEFEVSFDRPETTDALVSRACGRFL